MAATPPALREAGSESRPANTVFGHALAATNAISDICRRAPNHDADMPTSARQRGFPTCVGGHQHDFGHMPAGANTGCRHADSGPPTRFPDMRWRRPTRFRTYAGGHQITMRICRQPAANTVSRHRLAATNTISDIWRRAPTQDADMPAMGRQHGFQTFVGEHQHDFGRMPPGANTRCGHADKRRQRGFPTCVGGHQHDFGHMPVGANTRCGHADNGPPTRFPDMRWRRPTRFRTYADGHQHRCGHADNGPPTRFRTCATIAYWTPPKGAGRRCGLGA
jgi:hypothetical protein